MKKVFLLSIVFFFSAGSTLAMAKTEKEMMEAFGEKLMFDKTLSTPEGQSCATCHSPQAGWTGPDSDINATTAVYPGAIPHRFGNRKPPSAAYATTAPLFDYDKLLGGNFWDGRATGEELGNPAADQAMGPFINPVEQNSPDSETIVFKVCEKYGKKFQEIAKSFYNDFNLDICASENSFKAYDLIASSIAVFEDSEKVNKFNSQGNRIWN